MAADSQEHVDLAGYVGLTDQASESDQALAADSAEEAEAMVDNLIGETAYDRVPSPVRRRAILEVGADLYWRKASRNGVIGFDGGEATPLRLARDPMLTAASILQPYLIGLA